MNALTIEAAIVNITENLRRLGCPFALVGGLAVSYRAEVRFTRDVDLAVAVQTDAQFEALIFDLRSAGYVPVATVEHVQQKRLATARLASPTGFVVDLLASSCGIEGEIVERATLVELEGIGTLPVARAEELLAMKILSMSNNRLQDRIDARNLLIYTEDLDISAVQDNINLITSRGFHRGEDLQAKFNAVMSESNREH